VAAVLLLALLVYALYRHSARIADFIGATGTTIIVRLSAFLCSASASSVLERRRRASRRLPFGTTGTG